MSTINLKQLAHTLDLSVSTVSRALNDSYEISAATKLKVQALAAELGYQPNPYASSLRRQQSQTVGVVIPEVANNFFSLAINGIEEVARQNGYHVLIYLTHEDFEQEQAIVRHLASGRVDGILMSVSGETRDAAHFAKLRELKLPTVFFDRVCELADTASITTDDYDSGYRATRHLLERGCRRIVHFTLAQHLSIGQKRMQGYLDALRDADIVFDPALLVRGGTGSADNTALVQQVLEQDPSIDGIFAAVESLAIAGYRACHATGRRIPQDVKIIGFSNLEITDLLDPPLTTIRQPAYAIGREAATILFQGLMKNRLILPSQSQELKSELVVRASTGG